MPRGGEEAAPADGAGGPTARRVAAPPGRRPAPGSLRTGPFGHRSTRSRVPEVDRVARRPTAIRSTCRLGAPGARSASSSPRPRAAAARLRRRRRPPRATATTRPGMIARTSSGPPCAASGPPRRARSRSAARRSGSTSSTNSPAIDDDSRSTAVTGAPAGPRTATAATCRRPRSTTTVEPRQRRDSGQPPAAGIDRDRFAPPIERSDGRWTRTHRIATERPGSAGAAAVHRPEVEAHRLDELTPTAAGSGSAAGSSGRRRPGRRPARLRHPGGRSADLPRSCRPSVDRLRAGRHWPQPTRSRTALAPLAPGAQPRIAGDGGPASTRSRPRRPRRATSPSAAPAAAVAIACARAARSIPVVGHTVGRDAAAAKRGSRHERPIEWQRRLDAGDLDLVQCPSQPVDRRRPIGGMDHQLRDHGS